MNHDLIRHLIRPLTRSAHLASPIGVLTLVATVTGLRELHWDADGAAARVLPPEGANEPESPAAEGARATAVLAAAECQLQEYFAGERTEFDLPLDPVGTPFQHAAWATLRTIPFGSTWTYGAQARAMGDARKARAVGAANGRNPLGIVVPCHRVVGADGSLTGFAGGLATKAWLLEHERRVISGDA